MLTKILVRTSLFLLFALILLANLKSARWGCFNNYDIGIYHQAMVEIASPGGGWNPYLTGRGCKIFNDHFDPVVIIAAGFLKITALSVEFSVLWEWLVLLLGFFLLWKKSGDARSGETTWVWFLFLFSAGILQAVQFPLHASFWSVPIWILALAAWLDGQAIALVAWLTFLCFFKESYPFSLISFGGYLFLFEKKSSLAIRVLAAGLLILLIGMSRPLWLGPINDYGALLLRPLFAQPWPAAVQIVKSFEYKSFLHLFLPLGLLTGWHLRNLGSLPEEKRRQWIGLIFLLVPLFAMQVLRGTFAHQYSFPFFVAILYLIYRQRGLANLSKNRKLAATFIVIFIVSGFSSYRSAFETVFLNKNEKCDLTKEKKESQVELFRSFDEVGDRKVASTGGILVPLLRPQLQIFHIGGESEPQTQYDYIVLERNNSGDSYRLSAAQVEKIIASCESYATKILKDDSFFYFAKGPFPQACLTP